jgi:hypothetical protein
MEAVLSILLIKRTRLVTIEYFSIEIKNMISASYVITLLFVAFINYPTPCESLKCYECSGNKSCGQGQTDHVVDCAGKCMSYLNEDDSGKTKKTLNITIRAVEIDL